MAEIADGVIVGSAIIKTVEKYGKDAASYVSVQIRKLKNAIRK